MPVPQGVCRHHLQRSWCLPCTLGLPAKHSVSQRSLVELWRCEMTLVSTGREWARDGRAAAGAAASAAAIAAAPSAARGWGLRLRLRLGRLPVAARECPKREISLTRSVSR